MGWPCGGPLLCPAPVHLAFNPPTPPHAQAAAERGVDFDRIKARSMTVEEAERWANSKRRKKNAKATGEDDEEDVDGSSYEWSALAPARFCPRRRALCCLTWPGHLFFPAQWLQASTRSG